ncbi:hypothetical protein ACEWY4_004850 [Coilia grayii]|uniref:RUN domain-containing protein n=1 Tax=Coilia grayii TaxID=363190 RepID=A0ABD1KNB0_9TELE
MMDSPASLSGGTLFLRQAPLVLEHQPPAWKLCGAVPRPARPRSLDLAYTISLPAPASVPVKQQQQQPQQHPFREALSALSESEKEEDGADVVEKRNGPQPDRMPARPSPSPHRAGGQSPLGFAVNKDRPLRDRGTPRWVNPFIPEEERNEEEEEEEDDLDGDNLHKYQEDFSFQLHGDASRVMEEPRVCPAEPCRTESAGTRRTLWSQERGVSRELEKLSQQEVGLRPRSNSRGTPTLMDCGETEGPWGEQGDSNGGPLKGKHPPVVAKVCPPTTTTLSKPQQETEGFTDNVSDSSCNSSDGVLVTFSAIYNKSHNAVATVPFDLPSPIEPSHGTSSLSQDGSNATPCWSPQGTDSNCNYQLDCEGVPSPLASELASAIFRSHTRLAAPSQNYYKLVTCDISSQSSPSPAWSSVTSCSEGHSQSSPTPPAEYFLFRRDEGEGRAEAFPGEEQGEEQVEGSTKGNPFKTGFKGTRTSVNHSCDDTTKRLLSPGQPALPRIPSCPSHLTSDATRQPITSFAEKAYWSRETRDPSSLSISPEDHQIPPGYHHLPPGHHQLPPGHHQLPPGDSGLQGLCPAKHTGHRRAHAGSADTPTLSVHDNETLINLDPDSLPSTSKTQGACPSSPGTGRFSKDQRPTSLPIQPFVLQLPPGQQQKPLGSLLNQYLTHGKPGAPRAKGKGKGKAVPSYLRPSPLGGYPALHLDMASSSDTCSTCTPSPVPFPLPHHRHAWGGLHRPPSPPATQCHPEQTLSSSSNPFRSYVSQSSAEEALDCQRKFGEGFTSSTPHSGAGLSLGASSHSCSPKPAPRLPSGRALEPSPRMLDPFQSLSLSSCGSERQAVHRRPSPAVTSVTCLNTPPCLASHAADGRPAQCTTSSALSAAAVCRPAMANRFQGDQQQHLPGESFSLTDRPPEEFCLSPEASSDALSIDLLQKKALLRAVSSAVDLIVAYFEHPSRDPDEKIQLGNSTLNPSIAQLVLSQLCPAIRNILQDGLRAYTLDLIVGQRRNQPWDIVLASTQPGPTTRVLHSLVSVVSKCSQLTKHSMRFNAFILGLLNLHALEFWLNHLYTCIDALRPLYQHCALVPLWEGPCRPHLHELLLLLEPLAALPFDLHLLSEPRLLLLKTRPSPLPAQSTGSSPQMSAASANENQAGEHRKEQAESGVRGGGGVQSALLSPQTFMQFLSPGPQPTEGLSQCRPHSGPLGGSSASESVVGWWLRQPSVVEAVRAPPVDTQRNRWMEERRRGQEGEEEGCERGMQRTEGETEERSPQELRWARLFGGRAGAPTRTKDKQQDLSRPQKNRLPSHWLSLDGSALELLAQSVWSGWRQDPHHYDNHTPTPVEGGQH